MKTPVYKRLVRLVLRYWPYLLGSSVAALVFVTLNSFSIWLTASLVNNILNDFDSISREQLAWAQADQLTLNERLKYIANQLILQDSQLASLRQLCLIIFGVFFVALFLGFMKRKSEIITLKNSAGSHRKVLSHYTKISLNISVFISAVMILAIFTIYSVIGPFHDGRLILTVPFIAFIILRLSYLSKINHILIQKNEFYKDKLTAIAIISYSIFTLILLYTDFYSNFI